MRSARNIPNALELNALRHQPPQDGWPELAWSKSSNSEIRPFGTLARPFGISRGPSCGVAGLSAHLPYFFLDRCKTDSLCGRR